MKFAKRVIWQNVIQTLVGPFAFFMLLVASIPLVLQFPYLLFIFLALLFPKIGLVVSEAIQSYFILILAIISTAFGKKFTAWKISTRENVFCEDLLRLKMLI